MKQRDYNKFNRKTLMPDSTSTPSGMPQLPIACRDVGGDARRPHECD